MTRRSLRGIAILLVLAIHGSEARAFHLPLEAEHFKLDRGWIVTDYGYFPAQPNLWSRNKIQADATDRPARATQQIEIPASHTYNLWVRYESCFGFGSVFTIQVLQNNQVKGEGVFGRRGDQKYFPFGHGLTVQGPWSWHNTDYVYQGMSVSLEQGPATIIIRKEQNESPAACRVIDLLYLTDDLQLKPGDDARWDTTQAPPILSDFTVPLYLRARVRDGEAQVSMTTAFHLMGYYHGPREILFLAREGFQHRAPDPANRMRAGEATGWQRIEVSACMPPVLTFTASSNATVVVDIARDQPANIVKTVVLDAHQTLADVMVSIGKTRYEAGLLGKHQALTLAEIYRRQTDLLSRYRPPGKPARQVLLAGAIRSYAAESFQLGQACGLNAEAYQCHPEIYGSAPLWPGYLTATGFITLQNAHMTPQGYAGDYAALQQVYSNAAAGLRTTLGREIPCQVKLIEESGPPPFDTLLQWPQVKARYEGWLTAQGLNSEKVRQDKAQFFYYSNRFRAWIFARLCADATRLIEQYYPAGTRTDSGSINPSTGYGATLERGEDVFLLFKERGVTAFSSEISWGWGGTPDYLGPQTESYEAALARALSKYHAVPMGSYLISDGNRGFTGDFVEMASYTLFSQGFRWLHYYDFGLPSECCFLGYPDILTAIKKVNYAMGATEEALLSSKVVPATIAVGWSSTTDIWDLSRTPQDPSLPGNCVYPSERQLIYLLLRHRQHPVDILAEEDLAAGYLKDYRVYVLVSDHLRPEAAEALKRWVDQGGTLISVAGGGLWDHCNQPLDTLKPVFGILATDFEKRADALRPKLELLHAQPVDRIHFITKDLPGWTLDAFGYRQTFKVATGKVIGYYTSGEIAAVRNKYGQGTAIILGALPGAAYVKPAIPLLPFGRGGTDELSQFIPTRFSADVARIFDTLLADEKSPLVCSHPLVEAVQLRNSQGYVIPVLNFSQEPRRKLTIRWVPDAGVTIRDVQGTFGSVRTRLDDTTHAVSITLPRLDKFECLRVSTSAATQ